MALYFLLLDARRFADEIVPALAAAWRERSFAPCRSLCESLKHAADKFGREYYLGNDESMLDVVLKGVGFDRVFWRALAGEVLWFAAVEAPEVPTALETLLSLLGQSADLSAAREQWTPIRQAHHGSRDLVFGNGYYRPTSSGYNDSADVARLAGYLDSIDPDAWDSSTLSDIAEAEDREEELDYARQCFVALREMYRRAHGTGQVVVCEEM